MNTEDRAETIAAALIWLIGLALFVWSWQTSDSFIAALVITAVGGFFLVLFLGPLIAVAALVITAVAHIIAPPRP